MYNTNMYIFADKMIKRYIWIFERCGAVQIYNQENWSTKVVEIMCLHGKNYANLTLP